MDEQINITNEEKENYENTFLTQETIDRISDKINKINMLLSSKGITYEELHNSLRLNFEKLPNINDISNDKNKVKLIEEDIMLIFKELMS